MAGLTSSIPAAVTNLNAKLATIAAGYTAPRQLMVVDGDIGTNVPPCWVQIGGWTNWTEEPAGIGNQRRNEGYHLAGTVNWYDGGSGPDVADSVRQAAFGVHEQLVAAVTADPTLGGAVRYAQVIGGPDGSQGVANVGGWEVQLEFTVSCEVQLEQ